MASMGDKPFSAHQASKTIKQKNQETYSASGFPTPSYTEKDKSGKRPSSQGSKLTFGKAISAVKSAADIVGLDGEFGFQNTFGSIKGMGRMNSKKKK